MVNSMESLVCLSMNGCGIESLEGFPSKCKIQRLELIDNRFPASDLVILGQLEVALDDKSLQSLSLGSNSISTIQDLKPLGNLRELVQLDVSDTKVAKLPDYREALFSLIPHLQILDNQNKDNQEIAYSEDDSSELLDEDEEESSSSET